MQDIEGWFEVVGDGGEVDLASGFGNPAPSHLPEAIASFPCSKDLLDPPAHPVDRLVPVPELLKRLGFVAAPHAGGDDARGTALGANRIAEVALAVSAVREDLAGIVGQRIATCPAIVDIGGCDGDLFDNCRVGISADMGLEAVNGWLALVLDPSRVAILFTGRGYDRGIDQRAGLDRDRPGLELRSSSASASSTSERSYQIDSNNDLNIARGGQAASPLALA